MKRKEEYPIEVLIQVKDFLNIRHRLIKKSASTDNYFVEYRSVEHNNFRFQIKNYQTGNKPYFEIVQAPASFKENNPKTFTIQGGDIQKHLDYWINLLEKYHQLPNPHEDEEDRYYRESKEEIYNLFELDEEDAYEKQYSLNVQLAIDKFLEKSVSIIENHTNPENEEKLKPLLEETKELKERQTHLPKGKVVEGLSSVIARAKKYSLGLAKELLRELFKESLKDILVNGGNAIRGFIEM